MNVNEEFSLDESPYDMTTFYGRLRHYINVTDPSTLLYSDEKINESKMILKKYKETGIMCGNINDMWKCRRIVEASIHPVTDEIIPKAFRVSAIAPVNIPIVFGMIACPSTNVIGTIGLHWINQSYNTACNYANRSGSSQSIESLMKAYVLAVSSACGFAYGLGKIIQKFPSKYKSISLIVPCVATAAANISNISFTRLDEITNGAPVTDINGINRGLSKIAGTQAVTQSALTRCVLVPCACLMLPPAIMSALKYIHLLPSNPRAVMLLELSVIYLSLQAALPAALAVYPQSIKLKCNELEEQFHNLKFKDGTPIQELYANKGL